MEFTENDCAHMHDCVYHVIMRKPDREELRSLFSILPEELKEEAIEFGMNDTLWRDHFIEWFILYNSN